MPVLGGGRVMTSKPATVNIRPGVSILSVLRHPNYKPWFALAEFVDNSIQSFEIERDEISAAKGTPASLKVTIEIDAAPPSRIIVRDNAAGIRLQSFPRAFLACRYSHRPKRVVRVWHGNEERRLLASSAMVRNDESNRRYFCAHRPVRRGPHCQRPNRRTGDFWSGRPPGSCISLRSCSKMSTICRLKRRSAKSRNT